MEINSIRIRNKYYKILEKFWSKVQKNFKGVVANPYNEEVDSVGSEVDSGKILKTFSII